MPVTAVAVASTVATTVSQIADANKRRQIESNLSLLDNKQRYDLEKKLQATNNVNQRIQILVGAVAQIRSAQSTAILSSTIQAKAKKERTLAIVIVGGAIAVLLAVVLLKRK